MGLLSAMRVGSIVHRFTLGTCSSVALANLCAAELASLSGATMNALRIPERWLHKKQPAAGHKAQPLDYWGNSHQVMHVLTVLAMWFIYESVRAESRYVLENPACFS
jgi:predicted membrane channel-forming protein YqfA (hemolysin III family)